MAYFLYAYTRPYKSTYVNIIEMALLPYLAIYLSMLPLQELQALNNIRLDRPSYDSCGNEVPSVSPEGIVFGLVYFLPVTVLLFFLGQWALRLIRKSWYDLYVCTCMCVCVRACVHV